MRCFSLGLILLFLCASLPASVFADSPVYARLVVPLFFESQIPEDVDQIARAVDQMAREKIGASVKLVPLLYLYEDSPDPRRIAEFEMLEKQGITFDLYPDILPNMQSIALDELLARYGQGILAGMGDFRLSFFRAQGPLHRIPSLSDSVATAGIALRKDLVDRYSVDVSRIRSLADLGAVFDHIHQYEPDLKMVSPYLTRSSLLARFQLKDALPSSVCDLSPEDPNRIVNYYATPSYRETVEIIRRWYEKGYLPDHMALQSLRASQLVSAGELFSYFCAYRPSVNHEESLSCGTEMVTVSLTEPLVTRLSLERAPWCVSATCTNPGKAVQFLNLLYTDSELVNLLLYGIEGVHYALQPDGTIEYPEGVTARTVGYQNTLGWLLPNQTLSYVFRGNSPRLWDELLAFNESSPVSGALDFVFDDGPVAAENERLNEIASTYAYGLETGQLDPKVYLPRMLAEMEAAGAARVIDEAQAQFDRFTKERNASP